MIGFSLTHYEREPFYKFGSSLTHINQYPSLYSSRRNYYYSLLLISDSPRFLSLSNNRDPDDTHTELPSSVATQLQLLEDFWQFFLEMISSHGFSKWCFWFCWIGSCRKESCECSNSITIKSKSSVNQNKNAFFNKIKLINSNISIYDMILFYKY